MTTGTDLPIYSDLAGDETLGELVELFVREVPDRVTALEKALAAGDLKLVNRLAHQLAGASGSYGFHELRPLAVALEFAAADGDAEPTLREHLQALADTCRRMQPGPRG